MTDHQAKYGYTRPYITWKDSALKHWETVLTVQSFVRPAYRKELANVKRELKLRRSRLQAAGAVNS